MIPYKKSAFKLFFDGARALAEVEANGIRMDVPYLDKSIAEVESKISTLELQLEDFALAKKWRNIYGVKTNYGSPVQMSKMLFEEMGYQSPETTASGRYKTDEKTLVKLNDPFINSYFEVKKLQKILTTYLKGIRREVVDGYLHPFFNLHTTRTFRSSSNAPNFQNLPVRNPELGRLVRQAFIAREGRHLVEVDYSGVEVCIAACYHKDPTMVDYIKDKSKDLHRDMATECFCLPASEMIDPVDDSDKKRIKRIRYCGKNMFVFPQFYGDWYRDCAKALWGAVNSLDLKLRDGTSLKSHLAKLGFKNLKKYEGHIQRIETDFWEKRFPVYTQWKKDLLSQYWRDRYLVTKTGFVVQGEMRKNEVINYPVQGTAFHCLLRSLSWIVLEELKHRKMNTLIVGQIHDSIVADVPAEELSDFLGLVRYVMTERLPREWDWINVPLDVEAEVAPLNGSWADKKAVDEE